MPQRRRKNEFVEEAGFIERAVESGDLTREEGTDSFHDLRRRIAEDITFTNIAIERGEFTEDEAREFSGEGETLLTDINAGNFLMLRGRAEEIRLSNRGRIGIIPKDIRTEDDFRKENVNDLAILHGMDLREFDLGTSRQSDEQIEDIRTKFFEEEVGVETGTVGDTAARFRDFFTGTSLDTEESTTLPFANTFVSALKLPGFLLTDVEGKMDILLKEDPKTTFRFDSGNNIIATNGDGEEGIVQKSGFSEQDAAELVLTSVPFVGVAAKIGTGGKLLFSAGKQALGAAAVDIGLQATQIAAGRERPLDPAEILTVGALGGAGELAAPLIKGAVASVRGFRPQEFAPEASALIKAGKELDIPIITSDVIQPTTRVGQIIRNAREESPVFGLGPIRNKQDKAIETAIAKTVDDLNLPDRVTAKTLNDDFITKLGNIELQATDEGVDVAIRQAQLSEAVFKESNTQITILLEIGNLSQAEMSRLLKIDGSALDIVLKGLAPEGKANVRSGLINDLIRQSRNAAGEVDGTKLSKGLDGLLNNPIFGRAFNKKNRQILEGARIIFDPATSFKQKGTALAQTAKDNAILIASSLSGNLATTMLSVPTVFAASRIYESRIVRDYLLRVAAAKAKSPAALAAAIRRGAPAVNAFLLSQQNKER